MFNLAYFFPLSFWHIIIIFSFLKHQKPNIRAFRSKGAICPHIPSFILCFLFYISRLDIYHPSLLYMFAVSTMSLLPCFIPKVSGSNWANRRVFASTRSYINQRDHGQRIRKKKLSKLVNVSLQKSRLLYAIVLSLYVCSVQWSLKS